MSEHPRNFGWWFGIEKTKKEENIMKIIKEGKYKGFEVKECTNENEAVLTKDNTTVTITKQEDGTYNMETKTELGNKHDWDSFWK